MTLRRSWQIDVSPAPFSRRIRAAGGRGFTAGMAAANHDNVESRIHGVLEGAVLAEAGEAVKNYRFSEMFHVKHCRIRWNNTGLDGRSGVMDVVDVFDIVARLFPDAEIPENNIQNILDINPANKASERMCGGADLLGEKVLARRDLGRQGPAQGCQRIRQRVAVALPGDQRRLGSSQKAPGKAPELEQELIKALTCGR